MINKKTLPLLGLAVLMSPSYAITPIILTSPTTIGSDFSAQTSESGSFTNNQTSGNDTMGYTNVLSGDTSGSMGDLLQGIMTGGSTANGTWGNTLNNSAEIRGSGLGSSNAFNLNGGNTSMATTAGPTMGAIMALTPSASGYQGSNGLNQQMFGGARGGTLTGAGLNVGTGRLDNNIINREGQVGNTAVSPVMTTTTTTTETLSNHGNADSAT